MEGFQEAAVTRQGQQLQLRWFGEGLGTVRIYTDTEPDFMEGEERLLATVDGFEYETALQPNERQYFLLVAQNGARIRVAERVIPMDGLVNFRDLGGYLTIDGRRTRWGKLLRSAAHDGISDRDQLLLQNMGLKTVIDYRSHSEEAEHPDRRVAGVVYQHLRPFEDSNATNILDVQQFQTKTAEEAMEMLRQVNKLLAVHPHCNQIYREMVQIALDLQQVPMVQHCTAGKDRVGVGCATLLMALGVPRETIMADYLLSNENQLSVSKLKEGAVQLPLEQIQIFEALTKVQASYLETFFQNVDEVWGGTEGYLKQALGLCEEDIAKLQQMYLEKL